MTNPAHKPRRTFFIPVTLGLAIPFVGMGFPGCKKDEPPPPLPSADPVTAPTAPLVLEPEDAGPEDAGEDAKKKPTGPFKPAASLSACCAALSQNAKSAPPPTNLYMAQAAAVCGAMAAQGKDKQSAASAILGALKGAGMPAACR